MDFFFHPKGIALIGATATPTKGGYAILKNLLTGFKGGIYPVNPRYTEIEGVPCYPSVDQVPDPVDMAIVFVPGRLVPAIVEDCARRGIRGIMIESGGFAESGESGLALQEEVLQVARKHGIRLWGPNCMGLVDAVRGLVFSFVAPTIWENLIPGNVSLIVQSGMLSGAFLIDSMTHGVMGISKVCSIGNKMDVNECELLEYLLDDPDTAAVGLYLESIPDGRRLMDICRQSPKPVVLLRGGKSPRGAAAAMSHTASLAGNGAVIRGCLVQAGVIEAKDFKQMMDICRALAMYPDVRTAGDGRVAVLTYSGGAGIVSADFIHETGLELATLSDDTRTALKSVFPEWMPVSNPVDLWPAVERNGVDRAYGTALASVCADPGVDAVYVHAFTGGFALNLDIDALTSEARAAGKPMAFWLLGRQEDARQFQEEAQARGVPVYREVYRAVECLDAVFERKRMLTSREPAPPETVTPALPEAVRQMLETERGVLEEYRSKQIVGAAGVPIVAEAAVDSVASAREAAERFGFPVVMKGLVAGQVHKTEAGLVRLGIGTAAAVASAFETLRQQIGPEGTVLVQRQEKAELELMAGMVRDPQFGPCVMVGLGGVWAEVLDDVAFAAAPLSRREALNLIGRLRSQRLLNGFRGAAPVDRDVLAQVLVDLGNLGAAYSRVQEIDINPLLINEGKPVAVDATVILS